MPIDVQCACGRKSVAPDRHAGKKAKCPACGSVMVIPGAARATVPDAAQIDELAEAAFDPFGDVRPAARPAEPPAPRRYKILTQKHQEPNRARRFDRLGPGRTLHTVEKGFVRPPMKHVGPSAVPIG
jgi:hypothetical protein